MTTATDPATTAAPSATSLDTAAARNLASTTKTPPQMQGISSRWLLKILPWVQVSAGTFRVNRRLSHTVGNGRVEFVSSGAQVRVIPAQLTELPALHGLTDQELLTTLAGHCEQREYGPGDRIATLGDTVEEVLLIAHGKIRKLGPAAYDDAAELGTLADGDYTGDEALAATGPTSWPHTLKAVTRATVLALPLARVRAVADVAPALRDHLEAVAAATRDAPARNKRGEADIALAAGHTGEPALPGTYVEYDLHPREYELSVAQTVLRVHSRVADLYSEPMDQVEQQLRLTVQALRERQEHELVNNREFGLLHNADLRQRIHTRSGPPTPDDLDELISRRRKTQYLLAHPRTIAAFGRQCSARGIYPQDTEVDGVRLRSWRGIPLLPCDKIPVTAAGTSSVLALRTGQENQGVVGLHQTGIPDEYEPSLNVRFMGINDKAVISYLVSAYYSAAVLVPDALGILEDVEI